MKYEMQEIMEDRDRRDTLITITTTSQDEIV